MKVKSSIKIWIILGALVSAATVLVVISPDERTLGAGIKAVYVHVSLTWAGMLGFFLAGALGILMLFKQSQTIQNWSRAVSWVALIWFASGASVSILAAKINWGDVYWREPRMFATLQFLGIATLVLVAKSWLPWVRLQGVLNILIVVILLWSVVDVPLVLHPKNPVTTFDSTTIQWTFVGMLLLSSLSALCLVWRFVRAKG
ncbi:MAG: hypothetical protein ACE5G1_04985 [bacterium]